MRRSACGGELSTLLTLSRQLSLAFSGGSYPADPVRRLLGAKYFTAGVRVALSGREYAAPLPVSDMLATARRSGTEGNAADTRLEIVPVGAGHVVRVRVRGARSVELMGDFTDWQPVTLEHTREHAWEIELHLSTGVHRINVRVDGGAWLVPRGARAETDEFGSLVGVIVVQ